MLSLWLENLTKAPFTGAFFFVLVLAGQDHVSQCHASQTDQNTLCEAQAYDEVATLEKVYDGDTIKLTDGRKVRLIGINSPEMGYGQRAEQAYAIDARETLKQFFARSRIVRLRFGKDKKDRYKRVLAHVFNRDGQNVAAQLIRRGLGYAIVVPPNDWQMDCYFTLEKEARRAGRFIWNHPGYLPKDPTKLKPTQTGFQIVEGRVTAIGHGKKTIWLDMGSAFALRVNRDHLQYFNEYPIQELKGRRLRVRGWVAYYNGKLRMSLKHPYMMTVLE